LDEDRTPASRRPSLFSVEAPLVGSREDLRRPLDLVEARAVPAALIRVAHQGRHFVSLPNIVVGGSDGASEHCKGVHGSAAGEKEAQRKPRRVERIWMATKR
jgi:hypothetical protein